MFTFRLNLKHFTGQINHDPGLVSTTWYCSKGTAPFLKGVQLGCHQLCTLTAWRGLYGWDAWPLTPL
eukprot:2627982-Rhodomonas_salina.1